MLNISQIFLVLSVTILWVLIASDKVAGISNKFLKVLGVIINVVPNNCAFDKRTVRSEFKKRLGEWHN